MRPTRCKRRTRIPVSSSNLPGLGDALMQRTDGRLLRPCFGRERGLPSLVGLAKRPAETGPERAAELPALVWAAAAKRLTRDCLLQLLWRALQVGRHPSLAMASNFGEVSENMLLPTWYKKLW